MTSRMKAAWKVLRGEWIAQPRVQFPSVWTNNLTSASNVTVTWKVPPVDPAAVGRAVRRHSRALALLSGIRGR